MHLDLGLKTHQGVSLTQYDQASFLLQINQWNPALSILASTCG